MLATFNEWAGFAARVKLASGKLFHDFAHLLVSFCFLFHDFTSNLIKKPRRSRAVKIKAESNEGQGETFASSDGLLTSRKTSGAGGANNIQRLSAGNSWKTVEDLDKLHLSKRGRKFDVRASAKAGSGCIQNADTSNDFVGVVSNLTAKNVQISFDGHGELGKHSRPW